MGREPEARPVQKPWQRLTGKRRTTSPQELPDWPKNYQTGMSTAVRLSWRNVRDSGREMLACQEIGPIALEYKNQMWTDQ